MPISAESGRAIGIALPYSLTYIASHPPIQGVPDPVECLAALARFVGINYPSPKDAVDALIDRIRSIQKEIGEPLSLRDAGITEDRMMREIETLIRIAEKDPNMYTTPIPALTIMVLLGLRFAEEVLESQVTIQSVYLQLGMGVDLSDISQVVEAV